jgi:sec-independent protein translocase protein TatA
VVNSILTQGLSLYKELTMTLLAYGFSPFTLVVLLIIVVLIFGNRLPGMMRSLGVGMTEFKKGLAQGDQGQDAAEEPQAVSKN